MPENGSHTPPAGASTAPDQSQAADNAGLDPLPPKPKEWPFFLMEASDEEIRTRLALEMGAILQRHASTLAGRCVVSLLDTETLIGPSDLDRVYAGLSSKNADATQDVLLILVTWGGQIEPAYQISKLCKKFSREKFDVVLPRQAKSAGTLIAIGADRIHMGPLSQLGPIDPQLEDSGLPALGGSQALETIAKLADRYPGSAEMFARYLRMTLRLEQIGYFERVCASAAQYAERLLTGKAGLPSSPRDIAGQLVHEYQDHGFVIDYAEATAHLGTSWVMTDTPELRLAEDVYRLFEMVNLFLGLWHKKYLTLTGGLDQPWIMKKRRS